MPTSINWTRAKCAKEVQAGRAKSNDWHPEGVYLNGKAASAARQICAECPIRNACLRFAKENRLGGIWGGVLLPYVAITHEEYKIPRSELAS